MNFRLKQLRKAKRMTQSEFADQIGVSLRTVGAWERGETAPDADQVWNCAEALGCSPSDIMGWYEQHARGDVLEDPFEQELIGCYRASTVGRKGRILDTARDAAVMSKGAAEPGVHESEGRKAM